MSAVRPKKYQCREPGCGKAYTQAHNLKSHRDSAHLELKPHCCDLCAKHFARKSDFDIHYQAQHGDRFSCTVRIGNGAVSSICGKQFTRRTRLRQHQRKAHGFILLGVPRKRASEASREPASDQTAAPTVTRAQPIPLAATAATAAAEGMGDDHDKIFDILCDEISGDMPLGSFSYLLQRLPNVNVRPYHYTLAHCAAQSENPNFIKACIAHGANLTLKDGWGGTPLDQACACLTATNIDLILGCTSDSLLKDNKLTLDIPFDDYPLLNKIKRLIRFHDGDAMPIGLELEDFRRTLAILSNHGITQLKLRCLENFTLRRHAIWLDFSGMNASNGFQIVQESRQSIPLEFRFISDMFAPGGYEVAIVSRGRGFGTPSPTVDKASA